MASKSDSDIPSSTQAADAEAGEAARPGRQRSKSSPAVAASGSGNGNDSNEGGKMEQLQIAQSPEHEAAGGGDASRGTGAGRLYRLFCGGDRRKTAAILFSIILIILLVGMIVCICLFILGGPKSYNPFQKVQSPEEEWQSLEVDLVFPGDPDYIKPEPGGKNPDGNQYVNELVAAYPWQSKACGMSYRNLKTERQRSAGGDAEAGVEDLGPSQESNSAAPPAESSSRIHHANSLSLKPGQIPWHLQMFQQSRETEEWARYPFCGASLISAHYALTAAHCLPYRVSISSVHYYLWVVGGAVRHDQLTSPRVSPHQKRQVVWVYPHKDWYPLYLAENPKQYDRFGQDIGLVYWQEPFRRLHTRDGLVVLSPACVPGVELPVKKHSLSYEGRHVFTGMGLRGLENESYPEVFDRVRYGEFIFKPQCNDIGTGSERKDLFVNNCPRAENPGRTTACQGDSGGPVSSQLLDPAGKRYFQSAVLGFVNPGGYGCIAGLTSGNVRVEAHAQFISHTVDLIEPKDIY